MNDANDNGKQKVVSSLRDLPRSVQPPRDLWASIESQITAAPRPTIVQRSTSRNITNLRWMAAAAVIAALAVGMWIGRSMHATGPVETAKVTPPANIIVPAHNDGLMPAGDASAFQAAYIADPKFRQTREALL